MPTTPIYGLRYQALTDAPNGATLGANLATDVETQLVATNAAVTTAQNGVNTITANQNTTPIIDVFTSSGTWTKHAGAVRVTIRVCGGGGGGGGVTTTGASQGAAGGGGGGGGYAEETGAAATYTATVAVTLGAGGAGGTAGANNGAAGGTSSFGAYLSATGGAGGSGAGAQLHESQVGGAGGVGSGGDVNLVGADGDTARVNAGSPVPSRGGSSFLGPGAPQAANVNSIAGTAAVGYGGGGSGALNRDTAGTVAKAGGAGANGVVIVITYFS